MLRKKKNIKYVALFKLNVSVVLLQVLYLLQSVYGYPQRNRAAGLVQWLVHFLLRHPAAVRRSGRKLWVNTAYLSLFLSFFLTFVSVSASSMLDLMNISFKMTSLEWILDFRDLRQTTRHLLLLHSHLKLHQVTTLIPRTDNCCLVCLAEVSSSRKVKYLHQLNS